MGKMISVWSATKRVGKTVFLFNMIKHMSEIISKDSKVLIVCTNLVYGNLMDLFGISNKELMLEDVINYKIHPDNSFDMFHALANQGHVYFLGSKMTSVNYMSSNMERYEKLFAEFIEKFDLVFVDASSGNENPLTNMIIAKSDYVINMISQDKERLDKYPFKNEKDLIYIVNNYCDTFPDEKELISLYKLKQVFTLPTCNTLLEMKNKGVLGYYNHHETEYNKQLKDIIQFLTKTLDLKTKHLASASKKKGIFKDLLGGKQVDKT